MTHRVLCWDSITEEAGEVIIDIPENATAEAMCEAIDEATSMNYCGGEVTDVRVMDLGNVRVITRVWVNVPQTTVDIVRRSR